MVRELGMNSGYASLVRQSTRKGRHASGMLPNIVHACYWAHARRLVLLALHTHRPIHPVDAARVPGTRLPPRALTCATNSTRPPQRRARGVPNWMSARLDVVVEGREAR